MARTKEEILKLQAQIERMKADNDRARCAKACQLVRLAVSLIEELQVSPDTRDVVEALTLAAMALAAFEPIEEPTSSKRAA